VGFFVFDPGDFLLKAVIFDMDGVIIDSEPLHKKTERVTLSPYGISLSDEELNSYMGTEAKVLLANYIDKYSLPVAFAELYSVYRRNLIRIFDESVEPIPATLRLIRALKSSGIGLAVGSSSHRELVELVLRKLDVTDAFSVVVTGEDAKRSKPHPDIFIEAVRRLGVGAEACLVIEDSANGVRAAKAAGIRCLGFRNPTSAGQDLREADWVVDSMEAVNVRNLRKWAGADPLPPES
jgi:HAD superfamily hydrolase (TIGR01509 family)